MNVAGERLPRYQYAHGYTQETAREAGALLGRPARPLREDIVAASSPAAVIDGAGQFSDWLVCGAFCSVGKDARGEETDDRTRRSERHRWVTLQSQRSGRQWRHDSCVLARSKRLVKKF